MGYKFFHFSIKITPLDLTKIRQHKDCTVVKPKIQNHLYKNYTPNVFQNPTTIIKQDLWSSSKYKIRFQSNIILSQPVFLKTMYAYFTKDIYIYKMSHFNFYYFYFTPYLIYNHNTAFRTEDPGKVFALQHLHLKNYFETENCEPNGLSEYYKF